MHQVVMMSWLDHEHIFFTALGYDLSYLEFLGWLTGLMAVWLSARAQVWSWPLGLVNVTLSFFLFYQVRLYPDMFLQVFFFITNIIGWWRWTHPRPPEEDTRHQLRISRLKPRDGWMVVGTTALGTVLLGLIAHQLHDWLPGIFTQPSASPFVDSFITVLSVVATFYMIQKKVECWLMWIAVDVVATCLYFVRDIKLYSLLYFAFCFMAAYGFVTWRQEMKRYRQHNPSLP